MKNAKLWKRIVNEGLKSFSLADTPDRIESMVHQIVTSTIIVDRRTTEIRGDGFADFKGMAFPFKVFWVEGWSVYGDKTWCGTLVSFTKGDVTSDVTMVCIAAGNAGPTVYGLFLFKVDAQGNPLDEKPTCGVSKALVEACNGEDSAKQVVAGIGQMACDTLMMMGCKNVGIEPRENDPKEVRRAVKRHGGNADSYRYHVLVVRPPGAKSGTKGEEIGTMPRHVCRGHSSEYGPEFGKGLLFGKYAGRFYIPPHMKGKKENGTVAKDYQVVAG